MLTDVTKKWLDLREALQGTPDLPLILDVSLNCHAVDYDAMLSRYGRLFLWTKWHFYFPAVLSFARATRMTLESAAGPFDHFVLPEPATMTSRIA